MKPVANLVGVWGVRVTGEEFLDQGKLSVIDETHTPNYIGHALPEHMRVPEGYKELVARSRRRKAATA